MIAMGFASFALDLALPGCWNTCMDVGGKYSGTVSGSMNMMGNFGGMASPLVIGFILYLTHRNWQVACISFSIVYFLGAFCWLFVNPFERLENETTNGAKR